MSSFGSDYQGARFYKCDLQMQTPVDSVRWRGAKMGATADEMRAVAEVYVRRCYEVGLEVIGITDHNFASRNLISLLQEAIKKLSNEFGYSIVLFPGFELEADVGKGLHVLALFEPDSDLEHIDHWLTECGVRQPRFEHGVPKKSTSRLPEILDVVQRKRPDGRTRGIVILPHPQGTKGLFDTDRIADWLAAEEWKNPELYCVEVPKPPSEMSQGWQQLFANGRDCVELWRRKRPVGYVMSSDAKALTKDEDSANFIGFRHTWIKMSRPSIEALRQAFLDHASRIRFGPESPETSYRYSQIKKLTVRNAAFLKDLDLVFSPNLNTIIGGRGTGKSTIVEYLRIVLGQEASIRGKDPQDNFKKLRGSISTATSLQAQVEKEGQIFEVSSEGGTPPLVTGEAQVRDLARFLPVRVLSQKEIYAIAEDPDARRTIVDDLIRRRLDELGREEQDLVERIKGLNRQIAALPQLQDRERVLETECRDLEVRLERLKAVEEPLARWKGILAEEGFFSALANGANALIANIRTNVQIQHLAALDPNPELSAAPHADLTKRVGEQVAAMLTKLKEQIEQSVNNFETGLKGLLDNDLEVAAWRLALETERAAFEDLRNELLGKGTDPDSYLSYQRDLRERQRELTDLKARIGGIDEIVKQRDGSMQSNGERTSGLIDELHGVWQQQSKAREDAALSLTEGVPKTNTGQPFVKVSVERFGDERAFLRELESEIGDHRRITAEDWTTFMRAVFSAARSTSQSPTEMLATWINLLKDNNRPANSPLGPSDRHSQVICQRLTEERLADLRLWRTPDKIRVELSRQDGSIVGELEGHLSVGQRCTAVLALLLARDNVPVVIDQPEEDLDNEFIFTELVPLLRKVKEERQVIVVSHNANIPVNADAELVIALETRHNFGCIKRVQGEEALGALDRAPVKRAVEDILEGSEEAFRLRFEKYGF